jgi:hypothetical protein
MKQSALLLLKLLTVLALAAVLLWPALDVAVGLAAGSAGTTEALTEFEKTAGIKVVSLRPTSNGFMLDLRYKVVDVDKAKRVLSKNTEFFVTDAKSGKTLTVPVTKSGPMKQTTLEPEKDRSYFTLFGNPNRLIPPGGSVDLTLRLPEGDRVMNGLRVLDDDETIPVRPELTDEDLEDWDKAVERQPELIDRYNACLNDCRETPGCEESCNQAFRLSLKEEE